MTDIDCLLEKIFKKVIKTLGLFHREHVYQRALTCELQEQGLFVEEEVNIPIQYPLGKKRITLGIERADIVVNQSCIIEVKLGSPKTQTLVAAMGQVSRYLRDYRTNAAKWALSCSYLTPRSFIQGSK